MVYRGERLYKIFNLSLGRIIRHIHQVNSFLKKVLGRPRSCRVILLEMRFNPAYQPFYSPVVELLNCYLPRIVFLISYNSFACLLANGIEDQVDVLDWPHLAKPYLELITVPVSRHTYHKN